MNNIFKNKHFNIFYRMFFIYDITCKHNNCLHQQLQKIYLKDFDSTGNKNVFLTD
jgi:hypothetical protein